MRVRGALAIALLGLAAAAFAATPWTLSQLLEGFAQTRTSHASFVETKTVRLLDRPLVSAGELRFEAPDRLEKRTLRPRPELLVLDGDRMTLDRGERHMQLDLRAYPQAAAFVESIRGTLAGDRAALERVYRLRLEGDERSWVLVLTPRDPGMASLVQRVRIAGRRYDVTVIEILQANGDSTLMSVQRLPGP
jgi:outer membrane lipoprotein-sorting protein